jgi:hypothetical protein
MSDIFKKGPSSLEKIERGLKKVENDLFKESLAVVHSSISHTFDLDPENPNDLPAEWLEELEKGLVTEMELGKRKRIAQAAMLSPKEAPVALQIAAKVLSGMQKARAAGDQGSKTLNVNVVTINAPMPVFEEKEIEHE